MSDNKLITIGRICTGVSNFSGIFFAALVFLTAADILGRFLFNRPIPGALELGTVMLPWIVFLGFAHALREGLHIRLLLVTQLISTRGKIWLDILAYVLGLVLFTILTYLGWQLFWRSFTINEIMMAAINVPWWIGKLAFPIGMFFMFLQYIGMLISAISQLRTKKGMN